MYIYVVIIQWNRLNVIIFAPNQQIRKVSFQLLHPLHATM